jgi:hypothetical protein
MKKTYIVPSDQAFFDESIKYLKICESYCTCSDGWHFIWASLKAGQQRRSIYYQQPLLLDLLSPVISKTKKILIAGAADSGILMVLNSIFGDEVRYSAFDICNAPLEQMKIFASEHDIFLTTHCESLLSWNSNEKFDLIFIHNTLNFLTVSEMGKVLDKFKDNLSVNGFITCGMRYEMVSAESTARRNQTLDDTILKVVNKTYQNHPELISIVSAKVDAYVDQKRSRGVQSLRPDDFQKIISNAGYEQIAAYQDDHTPTSILNNTPSDSAIRSDVYLMRSRKTT